MRKRIRAHKDGSIEADNRKAKPPSWPRDALGTLRDALGMPGRSGEALGCSGDALGTSSEQCRSPWAHFWTKLALNALAERPAERIFVNVGMSRGSSDVRSVPFLLMFCRCRAICASQAPRTAKPRKNIRLELENQRLRRPGRLPDGWWDQKKHVGQPVRAARAPWGSQTEPVEARSSRPERPGCAGCSPKTNASRSSIDIIGQFRYIYIYIYIYINIYK